MIVRLTHRDESGGSWPVLWWRCGPGWRMAASTVSGGGLGVRGWWLNAMVPVAYHHEDPAAHVHEIAAGLGLTPGADVAAVSAAAGVGMLTAADVTRYTEADDEGVRVIATVGLSLPVWAAATPEAIAAETGGVRRGGSRLPPAGTINVLVVIPVPLTDAALVNAVVTATEAKTQALIEAGVPGTGTSSDAVCIACPALAGSERGVVPEPYAGPRSAWGSRLARAVHAAVLAGATRPPRARPQG